jgi:hypothetical protein
LFDLDKDDAREFRLGEVVELFRSFHGRWKPKMNYLAAESPFFFDGTMLVHKEAARIALADCGVSDAALRVLDFPTSLCLSSPSQVEKLLSLAAAGDVLDIESATLVGDGELLSFRGQERESLFPMEKSAFLTRSVPFDLITWRERESHVSDVPIRYLVWSFCGAPLALLSEMTDSFVVKAQSAEKDDGGES